MLYKWLLIMLHVCPDDFRAVPALAQGFLPLEEQPVPEMPGELPAAGWPELPEVEPEQAMHPGLSRRWPGPGWCSPE